ncbi:ankyrin-1-like [Salvia hispanica]|uniref:ankyrin-1-like n=1 Tax=Salvia hispanica TaxID=49212 RepID=UPI00200921CF|nr:ankyrin-1-like [Salvia hispanica]
MASSPFSLPLTSPLPSQLGSYQLTVVLTRVWLVLLRRSQLGCSQLLIMQKIKYRKLNAMGSISEIGASIIEAGASGDLEQLKAIRNKVDDIREFRKICDEYSDFTTGWNVLHHVVEIGNFEICKFLIRTVKVYIDALNYNGDTPLAEAVTGEHVKIVKFLVKHGAQISLPNIEGFTPLHFALLKDNMELVELLLRKDALVNVDSVDGTPLQIAVSRGNVQAVKYILSRGAWPSLFCAFANTPLVCAVKSHSFECLELLLEAGADPNLFFSGISPLGVAAIEGDTKFLKRLLKAKADPDADLYKPIEEAAMVDNRAAVEILFPVTKRLAVYPNWTVDGIIEYIHSGEFETLREQTLINRLAELEYGGMRDASNKQYTSAILQYRMASLLEPSNPTWISKRSLWEARELNNTGTCMIALFDAQECIGLKPDFPVPHSHHGGDIAAAAANELFKKYLMAGLVFSIDPYNEEILRAFRLTLFNYFAWLSQMSSAEVILSFSL